MGAPSRLHRLILLLVFFSGGTAFAGSQETFHFPTPFLDNWSGVAQHYDGAKRVFEGDPEELLEIEVTFNGKPQTKAQIIPKDQSKRYLGKTDEGNAFPRGPPSALNSLDAAGRGAASLDDAAKFTDNILEVQEVGLQKWKQFQNRVSSELKVLHPNRIIGSQITIDVHIIRNGAPETITIIPDDLIKVTENGMTKYKIIDAKTSIRNNLPEMADLSSTCTAGQKIIYPVVDGVSDSSVTITKVEMRGENARQAFEKFGQQFVNGKAEISLEKGVEFWVNASTDDFTKYVIRPRIK